MKKRIALLLCALLILSLIPASALAAENEILDGRWLCADIQGNVTENTPAALFDHPQNPRTQLFLSKVL